MSSSFNIGPPTGPEILIANPPIVVGEHTVKLERLKHTGELSNLDLTLCALCVRMRDQTNETTWDVIFIAPAMRQFWNTARPSIGVNARRLFVDIASNWIVAELAVKAPKIELCVASSTLYELDLPNHQFRPNPWFLLDIIGQDYTRFNLPLPIPPPAPVNREDLKPLR
jgi:hypothetical protein